MTMRPQYDYSPDIPNPNHLRPAVMPSCPCSTRWICMPRIFLDPTAVTRHGRLRKPACRALCPHPRRAGGGAGPQKVRALVLPVGHQRDPLSGRLAMRRHGAVVLESARQRHHPLSVRDSAELPAKRDERSLQADDLLVGRAAGSHAGRARGAQPQHRRVVYAGVPPALAVAATLARRTRRRRRRSHLDVR